MLEPSGYLSQVPNITPANGAKQASGVNFSDVIKSALSEVSSAEIKASEMNLALQSGEDIPIHQVSLAMQKASLAFQTMNAARTRLVQAYQSVINMNI